LLPPSPIARCRCPHGGHPSASSPVGSACRGQRGAGRAEQFGFLARIRDRKRVQTG
jgi:hypothetical protein